MANVLIVEDHKETAEAMIDFIRAFIPGLNLSQEATGKGAIAKIQEERPDAVILDIALADEIDGIEVVRRIAASGTKTRFILVTALGNKAFRGPKPGRPWLEQLQDSERALVADFCEKNFNWKTFMKAIASAAGLPIPEEVENMAEF